MVAGATDPHPLTPAEIAAIAGQFAASARMAREAGFKIAELHAAHGYLLHSFLSPISQPPQRRLWRRPGRPQRGS